MTEQLQYEPELIFYAGSALLEGPVWDESNQLLYFISISDGIIYRFNPETTELTTYLTDGPVGAAVLDNEGKLLSAEKRGIYRIDPETGERTFICQPNKDDRLRYNDGKLDPKERFFIGTMGDEEVIEGAAALYIVEGSEYKEVLDGLTIANGLGWSEDGATFYHVESGEKIVRSFAFDMDTGELSDEKVLFEVTEGGTPDGLCVDLDGHLWVAEYGGGKACKWHSTTGEKLMEVQMPVSNVTSCCLGGKERDHLYLTTAKEEGEPLSGGLFKVRIR